MFLLRIILWIIGNAAALGVAVFIVPSITFSGTIEDWIIAGLILGLANSILKPILKLLAGPFIIVTFGLALIIVQSVILWITGIGLAAASGGTLIIDLPWGYIWGSIIIGIANLLFGKIRKVLTAPGNNDVELDERVTKQLHSISESVDQLKRHHRSSDENEDEDDDEEDDDY